MKYQIFIRNNDGSISMEFYHFSEDEKNYYSKYPWRETNIAVYLLSLLTPEELNQLETMSEDEADDILRKLYLQDKGENKQNEEYRQNKKPSIWQKLFGH